MFQLAFVEDGTLLHKPREFSFLARPMDWPLRQSDCTGQYCSAGGGQPDWLAQTKQPRYWQEQLQLTGWGLQLTIYSVQFTVYGAQFPSNAFVSTCPCYKQG